MMKSTSEFRSELEELDLSSSEMERRVQEYADKRKAWKSSLDPSPPPSPEPTGYPNSRYSFCETCEGNYCSCDGKCKVVNRHVSELLICPNNKWVLSRGKALPIETSNKD